MKVKFNDCNFHENGKVFDVKRKNVSIDITGGSITDNEELGELHVGDESELNMTGTQVSRNKKGFTIREYNENLAIIEQFVHSNLDKLNQDNAERLTQLLDTANNEENVEKKGTIVREIYDIAKNGVLFPLMGAGVEKAFEFFLT
jgi:hypothetical protein